MRIILVLIFAATLVTVQFAPLLALAGEGGGSLVVYTYEGFMKWGKEPKKTWDKIFGTFERRYGVKVEVREFPGMREALLALIAEARRGAVKADVIIGLTPILLGEAKEHGVVEKYKPRRANEVKEGLVELLDPEWYASPFDYSIIAFVYDKKHVSEELMAHLSFESFYNESLARMLVVENPLKSSVGVSFLYWQYVTFERLLGKDWKEWWLKVKEYIKVAGSWGEAYDIFLKGLEGRHIVVSYGTDPAYSYYFYNSTRLGASVVEYDGAKYSWLQVEGVALVKGAPHPKLAKEMIEWLLSPEVQSLIPVNNWMYPASKLVKLPPCYAYALSPEEVKPVNGLVSLGELAEVRKTLLESWLELIGG